MSYQGPGGDVPPSTPFRRSDETYDSSPGREFVSEPAVRNAGIPAHLRNSPAPISSPWAVQSLSPGWPARILLWSAILIGHLPSIVVLPFVMSGGQTGLASAYTVINIVAGAINAILAAVAFLLVRNTVWLRQLAGGAIYVLAGILVLTIPPLLTRLMYEVMLDLGPGLWIQSLIFAMFSVIITSMMLIGWNVARGRRWWVHVVAAGLALINVTIYWLIQLLFNITGVPIGLSTVFTQGLFVGLLFGALALLHFCGGLRGGSIPITARPTFRPTTWPPGYAPQVGYDYPAQPHYPPGPAGPGH